MTSSPRAVIFDFGGVIWNVRWDVSHALEEEHGLPRGSIFTTLDHCDAWHELERGRGDRDAWLDGAHRALEELAGRPLPPLHARWREAEGPIGESNADLTLRARLSDGLGIAGLFDDIVCSAEVGLAKPEPEVYALEPNVGAATAAGLRAVHHRVDRRDDLRAQLATAGVAVSPA